MQCHDPISTEEINVCIPSPSGGVGSGMQEGGEGETRVRVSQVSYCACVASQWGLCACVIVKRFFLVFFFLSFD